MHGLQTSGLMGSHKHTHIYGETDTHGGLSEFGVRIKVGFEVGARINTEVRVEVEVGVN